MAKGQEAKDLVAKRIIEAFGNDYIASEGSKYYVWSQENGEKVQVAIALTCPKVNIEVVNTATLDFGGDGLDFTAMSNEENNVVVEEKRTEISDKEKENIARLMKQLGL